MPIIKEIFREIVKTSCNSRLVKGYYYFVFVFLLYWVYLKWSLIIFHVNCLFEVMLKMDIDFSEKTESIIFSLKYLIILLWLYLIIRFVFYYFGKIKRWFVSRVSAKRRIDDFEDLPVSNIFSDLLGRKKTVKNIAKLIDQNGWDSTFTLLVDGKWGEGRTSIINMVKDELNYKVFKNKLTEEVYLKKKKRKIKNNYIFFDFNPWFFSTEKSIIKGFFDELSKIKEFKSEAKQLFNIICKKTNSYLDIPVLGSKPTLQEIKKLFSDKLKLRGKKLIIFIDDIDRLFQKDKILEVFKLVGEFQGLNNIVFVLSFDRNKVNKLLVEELKIDSEYLEKVINYPYKIYSHTDNVNNYFTVELKKIVSPEDFVVLEKDVAMNQMTSFFREQYKWQFRTIIQVKIFLHSFNVIYCR